MTNIRNLIKEVMRDHKNKIEVFQWAAMNSIGSLIYSEFIRRIKQKQYPTQYIMVPPIKTIYTLLDIDGEFMSVLSDDLIDRMTKTRLFTEIEYEKIPELILFTTDHIEILKTIFDTYILPNVHRRIPEVISKKFQIGDPSTLSTIMESQEACIFPNGISDFHIDYLIEETASQLLVLLPTLKKRIRTPEDVKHIQLSENDILIIEHQNAICPVHFTSEIFEDSCIMDLLSFVTNITVSKIPEHNHIQGKLNDYEFIRYSVSSNPFNSVSICNFKY